MRRRSPWRPADGDDLGAGFGGAPPGTGQVARRQAALRRCPGHGDATDAITLLRLSLRPATPPNAHLWRSRTRKLFGLSTGTVMAQASLECQAQFVDCSRAVNLLPSRNDSIRGIM
jgi:hypothetical protein